MVNDHIKEKSVNKFDDELVAAYLAYQINDFENYAKALESLRNFVWTETPYKQDYNDASEFLEYYVTEMSERWKQHMFYKTVRQSTCKNNHLQVISASETMFVTIKPAMYGTTRGSLQKFQKLEKQDSGDENSEFAKAFAEGVLKQITNSKVRGCIECGVRVDRESIVSEWPQFLFLQDFGPRPEGGTPVNTPLPARMNISGISYALHSSVIATSSDGKHFYCQTTVPNLMNPGAPPFTALIDNLSHRRMVLLDKTGENPATIRRKNKKHYNVFVCYRKLT